MTKAYINKNKIVTSFKYGYWKIKYNKSMSRSILLKMKMNFIFKK